MKLFAYLQKNKDKSTISLAREIAKKCDTSPEYLMQIAYGNKLPSIDMITKIVKATDTEVGSEDLNPKLMKEIRGIPDLPLISF